MFDKEIKLLNSLLKKSKDYNNNEVFWIEFKTNFTNEEQKLKLFGQNISGIANSCTYYKREYGYIVCGIEDETLQEIGVSFDPFNMKFGNQDLELSLRSRLVGVDFEFLPFKKNNKSFLIIEVLKSQGQISSFEKIQYFRQGKNIKKLADCSSEVQSKMFYSIKNSLFWNKSIIENLTANQILNLLHYDTYYIRQNKPIPTSVNNIVTDFLDEGFLVKNESNYDITFLGSVLLARNLYKIDELLDKRVRVITFKTRSKIDGYTNDIYGQKGYIAGFEDMVSYILSQVPEDQVVDGVLRRHKYKFSLTSIREFLANTLIHQDFLESSNPTVEIYPDRMEFVNIGICLVAIDRIMDAVPKTRNPKLVDIMSRLKICEKQGSGIDRAVKEIEQMVLPAPYFENKPNGFIATLYANKPFESYTEKEKIRACYLHVCLEYILQNENGFRLATNQTIRERFDIPLTKASTISNLIKKCIDQKLIRKFDPDNNSRKFQKYVPYWV